MSYVVARLREPGTLRSLAVALFAVLGLAPDDPRLEMTVQAAILLLALVSALMPERKAADPAAIASAVVQEAAPTVAAAASAAVARVLR